MTTVSTTHEGLERVLEGTRALSHAVGPSRSLRTVPLVLLTGIVTLVVASVAHRLDDWFIDGSTREWLALWAFGALVALAFARTAVALGAGLRAMGRRMSAGLAGTRAQAEFLEAVARDPRLAAEWRAAKDRADRD